MNTPENIKGLGEGRLILPLQDLESSIVVDKCCGSLESPYKIVGRSFLSGFLFFDFLFQHLEDRIININIQLDFFRNHFGYRLAS